MPEYKVELVVPLSLRVYVEVECESKSVLQAAHDAAEEFNTRSNFHNHIWEIEQGKAFSTSIELLEAGT